MKILFLSILMSIILSCLGQNFNDLQLANQYFKEKDCDKAITIYKSLSKSGINLQTYYKNYFNCLLDAEQYKQAFSLCRKMRSKYPNSPRYICDLGIVHKRKGENDLAKKKFDSSIKKLGSEKINDVHSLANQFNRIGEYQYVIKTYKKAQSLFPKKEFRFKLASAYRNIGNTEKMIDTYIDLIIKNSKNSRNIQITLQNTLGRTKSEDSYDLLKQKLLSNIQRTNNIGLMEMLVWFLIESEDYNLAFIYAKAIDKQLKENGNRVFDLAQLAHENSKYQEAIKCYQYLIDKNKKDFLPDAKILKLIAFSEKTIEGKPSEVELEKLKKEYLNIIQEVGKNVSTAYLMKEFAALNIFYLQDLNSAKEILNECLDILNKSELKAECKLLLGDIYLIENKKWDAILTYSQIDNQYKQNPIGHEAKFRRAKISYFQGDFDWAQAQLNVLKASTSKLIANNAMKLSLLITDNLGLDTSKTAMELYAKSELLEYQNKLQESHLVLDSIIYTFKNHTLTDEVLLKKAKIYEKQADYDKASEYYQKIIKDHSFDILADDALFNYARILENKLNKKEEAKLLYEKILFDHPDSIFTNQARKKYRELRGK